MRQHLPSLLALLVCLPVGCSDPDTSADPADARGTRDTSLLDATLPDTLPTDTAPTDTTPTDTLAITTVTPDRGFTIGLEQVEITGTSFTSDIQVFFGESLAQDIFVISSTRLVVLSPPRPAGLVPVRLVAPTTQQTAEKPDAFLYYSPVTITSVTPASAHILGGERLTIQGDGFLPDSTLLIGDQAALQTQVLDAQTITAKAPAAATAGPVHVRVSNALGVGLLKNALTYVDAPSLTQVTPSTGPLTGQTPITLAGSNFTEPVTVLVGSRPLDNLRRISATRITGTTPAATTEGSVSLTVLTASGSSTLPNSFTYLSNASPAGPLTLFAVTPAAGPLTGNTPITLTARGLVPGTQLTIGGRSARQITVSGLTLTALTPPSPTPGAVHVTVTLPSGESQTLRGAFTYLDTPTVTTLTPTHGPTTGGTHITVTGSGFTPGLELRIGALPAASVVVEGPTRLTAITPAGVPGQAQLALIQNGTLTRAAPSFTYDAPRPTLWAVDPPLGAQAGGTQVRLLGAGFAPDTQVHFGDREGAAVTVVSPTLILCSSPPGPLGVVSITAESPTAGNTTLPNSFTYFDPTSAYGGTWGDAIERSVNVTILSSQGGTPIPDAFVMLWTNPRTPYQGFTDALGQITFSGTDLLGEQMVSASKAGFSRASVVQFNAENVTLFLNPTVPPSSGEPPVIPPAIIRGVVQNLDKSLAVPIGKCSDTFGLPSPLCTPCTTSSQCLGGRCTLLPDQLPAHGSALYCTTDCASDAQCPTNTQCLTITPGSPPQCVPTAGRITAFCDVTNAAIFARDTVPDPGIEIDPDQTFAIDPGRFGELAVYCLGGVYNDLYQEFTPLVLGLARHVFAAPGEIRDVVITLDHALDRTQYITLDPVPRGPEGPDFNYLFPYIQLGSDGVVTLPPQSGFSDADPFIIDHFPRALTGDLYDASFAFVGGSFSFTDTNLPYTLTQHTNLTRLDDDTMFYHRPSQGWQPQRSGVTQNVNALHWAGDHLVGVGSRGLIIRSLGDRWGTESAGTRENLNAVHSLPGSAIAAGDHGTLLRWDGLRWQAEPSPTTQTLRGVWRAAPDSGWAVGAYAVLQRSSAGWGLAPGAPNANLYAVFGFSDLDVWTVGASGQIFHWDGLTWSPVPSGTSLGLRALWGAAPDDLWLAGEGGLLLHWDGQTLARHDLGVTTTLTALWGRSSTDVTVVGRRGTAFHWNGAAWTSLSLPETATTIDLFAIGGGPNPADPAVMTGSHELILGPILAVPESLSPSEGSVMTQDLRLSWDNQPGPDPHFSYVEVAVPSMFGPVPEWTMVNDFDVQSVLLPDFPSIEGTPGLDPGPKILTVFRVYKEGFDIDAFSNVDLNQYGWRSWSVNQISFTKQ